MAIYREDIVDIELESGTVFRSFMNKAAGEGDISGNRYGVRVFRNGEPVTLTGVTCVGLFINANGTTFTINGERTGNVAYVELPDDCYAVEGAFTLSIKLTGGGVTATARIVDGTIVNTTTEVLADPGSVIPDLSAFETLVERAEAAAEIIEGLTISTTQISGTRYRIEVELAGE